MRPPALPLAPQQYDQMAFDQLIRTLNAFFFQLANPNDVLVNTLQFTGIPGSGAGLLDGTVWRDVDVLKVTLANRAYPGSVFATGQVGAVTAA